MSSPVNPYSDPSNAEMPHAIPDPTGGDAASQNSNQPLVSDVFKLMQQTRSSSPPTLKKQEPLKKGKRENLRNSPAAQVEKTSAKARSISKQIPPSAAAAKSYEVASEILFTPRSEDSSPSPDDSASPNASTSLDKEVEETKEPKKLTLQGLQEIIKYAQNMTLLSDISNVFEEHVTLENSTLKQEGKEGIKDLIKSQKKLIDDLQKILEREDVLLKDSAAATCSSLIPCASASPPPKSAIKNLPCFKIPKDFTLNLAEYIDNLNLIKETFLDKEIKNLCVMARTTLRKMESQIDKLKGITTQFLLENTNR